MKPIIPFSALFIFLLMACSNDTSPIIDKAAIYLAQSAQENVDDQFYRGEGFLVALREMAEDRSIPNKQSRMIELLNSCKEIDRITRDELENLDRLRTALLKTIGANVQNNPDHGGTLVYQAHFHQELKPSWFDLKKVDYVGGTDFVSYGSANGISIVKSIQKFRGEIATILVASQKSDMPGHPFFFIDPVITDYNDPADFLHQMERAIQRSNVSPDDQEILKRIYANLSYDKRSWQELLPSHSSWVTAFHLLTMLQNDVLKARADALECLSSRISGDEYTFNKILVLTPGSEYAKAGTETDFEVMMAACDPDIQPIVSISGGGQLIETRDGKGRVRVKVPKCSELTITGTITILSKSGIPKTLPWTKRIVVGEK